MYLDNASVSCLDEIELILNKKIASVSETKQNSHIQPFEHLHTLHINSDTNLTTSNNNHLLLRLIWSSLTASNVHKTHFFCYIHWQLLLMYARSKHLFCKHCIYFLFAGLRFCVINKNNHNILRGAKGDLNGNIERIVQ